MYSFDRKKVYNLCSQENIEEIPKIHDSIDEQNEITKLFETIDIKLKILQNNIDETTNFKKGLLQQMFEYMPMHIILNFCAKICCIKYFLKS